MTIGEKFALIKNDPATIEVAGLFFYFTNEFTNNKGFYFL